MINVENLFHLFPEEDGDEKKTAYIDFVEKPIYKLGMWKKLILNHINFKKKVLLFFKQSNGEFDIEDIRQAGEFVAYNRGWNYIKDINVENDDHIEAIVTYRDDSLDTSLELGIKFFQNIEEYEKCAHLLKILKKSQEFKS
mgnify:CR=1 FL=1|jgi:hypothetical protein